MKRNLTKIGIWECLPYLGGGQTVAVQIADAIRHEYEICFILPAAGSLSHELARRNICYYILPVGQYNENRKTLTDAAKFVLKMPRILIEMHKLIKKQNICILYVNGSTNFLSSAIIGKIANIPIIWHVHHLFKDKKTRLLIELAGSFKCVKKIIGVSKTVGKQFPKIENKVRVIYNGVDTSKFTPHGSKSAFRKQYGIPEKKQIISLISWIMPTKRQDILIRAIPHVLKHVSSVHFVLVGKTKEGLEHYEKTLRQIVRNLGISEHITFAGHRGDIPALLRDIYINVITGTAEGFPLALLEGWSSAVPAVGPRIDPIPEFIEHRKTGLLFDFQRVESLAEGIVNLLSDVDLHKRISMNSLENVSRFTIAKFNAEILSLVREIL